MSKMNENIHDDADSYSFLLLSRRTEGFPQLGRAEVSGDWPSDTEPSCHEKLETSKHVFSAFLDIQITN